MDSASGIPESLQAALLVGFVMTLYHAGFFISFLNQSNKGYLMATLSHLLPLAIFVTFTLSLIFNS